MGAIALFLAAALGLGVGEAQAQTGRMQQYARSRREDRMHDFR